jgi:hypothetical protein
MQPQHDVHHHYHASHRHRTWSFTINASTFGTSCHTCVSYAQAHGDRGHSTTPFRTTSTCTWAGQHKCHLILLIFIHFYSVSGLQDIVAVPFRFPLHGLDALEGIFLCSMKRAGRQLKCSTALPSSSVGIPSRKLTESLRILTMQWSVIKTILESTGSRRLERIFFYTLSIEHKISLPSMTPL